jgi:NPCBM/NEW2 domain
MRKVVIAAATLAVATSGLAAVSGPATAGVPLQVTIKASSTQIKLGDTLKFTGKVGPSSASAGHQVVLQEKFKPTKPWKAQDTAKLDGHGRYTLKDVPTVNTDRKYRVVMPSTSKHAKGISSIVDVKVYGWTKLFDHPYVNPDNMYPISNLNLNGTTYPKSLVADWTGPTSIEFNVNHKCTALRGTFGVSDASETGAQATITAESDGTQIYTKTLALGQTDVKRLTLDSPLKLRFTAESVVADVNGYGGIGTPEIFCVQ